MTHIWEIIIQLLCFSFNFQLFQSILCLQKPWNNMFLKQNRKIRKWDRFYPFKVIKENNEENEKEKNSFLILL